MARFNVKCQGVVFLHCVEALEAIKEEGFQALPSALMPGQIRTDAPINELLRICEIKFRESFKLDERI